jgi:ATP-dependent HslUV protease subunit HslV
MAPILHGTTVLAVTRDGRTAVAGDGQVSVGETVVKAGAVKVRRIYDGRVVVGFAGSSADSVALFSKFENKLEEYRGNLARAAVELAKDWRMDRALRRLEALLIAADGSRMFLLSGTGDVVEPDDGLLAIGSGGPYALAAARALLRHTKLTAREVAVEALGIAASICVYTNANLTVEEIEGVS